MILNLFFLLVGALLLWRGADWLVDGAAAVARRFGVSELIIGLTVVAMGTSAPEFLVTFTAAFRGMDSISLANVVGSNIFNLGVILGVVALIRPVEAGKTLFRRDAMLLFCVVTVIYLMCRNGSLGRLEGALLAGTLLAYIGWLILQVKRTRLDELKDSTDDTRPSLRDQLALLAGVIAVGLGSRFLIDGATGVAEALGVSQWVIGLTIVAGGTSLPELVTCLAASVRGKNAMLLGNLIGSDLFNMAGVLGLTSLFRPLSVDPASLANVGLAAFTVGLVLVFVRTGWRVSRLEGGILLAVGLMRWMLEFI